MLFLNKGVSGFFNSTKVVNFYLQLKNLHSLVRYCQPLFQRLKILSVKFPQICNLCHSLKSKDFIKKILPCQLIFCFRVLNYVFFVLN